MLYIIYADVNKSAAIADWMKSLIPLPVETVSQALAAGATVYAISAIHLGRTVSIGQAWSSLRVSLSAILWAEVLVSFRAYALLGAGIAILILATAIGVPVLMALAPPCFLGGIPVAIFVLLTYSLAVPACVVEGIPGKQSLVRSKFLTGGALGRVFLIGLLAGVGGMALTAVLRAPVSLSGSFGYRLPHGFPVLHWSDISESLATIVSGPVATIATALLYYDLRVRKEALDIQMMMESVTADLKTAAV